MNLVLAVLFEEGKYNCNSVKGVKARQTWVFLRENPQQEKIVMFEVTLSLLLLLKNF